MSSWYEHMWTHILHSLRQVKRSSLSSWIVKLPNCKSACERQPGARNSQVVKGVLFRASLKDSSVAAR